MIDEETQAWQEWAEQGQRDARIASEATAPLKATLAERDAVIAEKEAEIADYRGALERIASHVPLYDYVMAPLGDSEWQPGSPYDRGRQDETKVLAGIARAALRARHGEGEGA